MGPWRGEVGFESLYWLPFLDWFREAYQIDPDRLIPISRGGASALYRTPMGLELYALRDPQDVRVANRLLHKRTAMLKQRDPSDEWDAAVIRDAAAKLKLRSYDVLHPGHMYRLYEDFWEGRTGLDWFRRRTSFVTIPPPPLPDGLTLPPSFLAVRFYVRPTFPFSGMTRDFVVETVKQLAARQPVIVLSTGQHVDDHLDYPLPEMANVQVLSQMTPLLPENNLAVMAAVLGRAAGFVGTYGGVAQLAMRMGKGSASFYTDWMGTAWAHKHLSEVVAHAQETNWVVERLMDIPLLQDVCPHMTVSRVSS